MAYYQAEEIRRLIENWSTWAGDGATPYSTSPIAWTDETYAKREARMAGPVVRPIALDASITNDTLNDMDPKLSKALKFYYLSRLTAETIARDRFKCGRRTYYRLVELAHPEFWTHYTTRKARPSYV